MTALPKPEDVDVAVAEVHTEVATVVTVASIIMGNVEDIEEATMVTVEDTEEATEVASEASEVVNEVASEVWICPYLTVTRI